MMKRNAVPAGVAAPRLIDIISNARREKDGVECVIVDGERLP